MIKQKTVYQAIEAERLRQDDKWGVQNHKAPMWLAILMEEVGEVAKEINDGMWNDDMSGDEYICELIQVAAVAVAAIESYRRNGN